MDGLSDNLEEREAECDADQLILQPCQIRKSVLCPDLLESSGVFD
jgi:hypothetical protein